MKKYIVTNRKVSYTYKHWLNTRSYTEITKKGIVIRRVVSKTGQPTEYIMVKLEGNKGLSKIHESKLSLV